MSHSTQRPDPLAPFVGEWSIRRDIFDLDSNWTGRFEGRGVFEPSTAGLAYAEEGELRFAGLPGFKATRGYHWRADGRHIIVEFEDGRFFHRFDPATDGTEATHFCDPDTYDVRYVFEFPNTWRSEWRVEGPRKDYRMVTNYAR
ncbi:hypothetical protein SAMN06273572_102395 [Monaibacterium marinum]|uniref:DUF6314 domain-containing protein n=1 Tax=Pontivivens marinum TaxID=1690039 RepID=A0A2C9CR68_9RHOB|nr:DUF6314 family protein [Monaibacterium marinum]SOH93717.1 hypothetical protein SAMN06273572_102395 [Monaibacterium marinum]